MADKPFSNPSSMTEQLQNLCWRLAVEMRALYTTVAGKLSTPDADARYLGITAKAASAATADTATKAASATTADTATKATQDGNGNVISSTYAKNTSIPTVMTGATASSGGNAGTVPAPAAGAQGKFLRGDGTWQTALTSHQSLTNYATTTALNNGLAGKLAAVPACIEMNPGTKAAHGGFIDFHFAGSTADYTARLIEYTKGTISAYGNFAITGSLTVGGVGVVPKTGSRGTLAGYETTSAATAVNATSGDSLTGSKITISNGTSGTAWTKIVGLSANSTVTLGSSWQWSGGDAPELSSAGILVCCWASTIGICNFVSGS